MAKATAICTCEKCGAEFKKEKRNCVNRKAADSWELWAVDYYTICPDCERGIYRKKQREAGLLVSFKIDRILSIETGNLTIKALFSGDSYNRKDELKTFGCKWNSDQWQYSFLYSDYESTKEKIIFELKAVVKDDIDKIIIEKYLKILERLVPLRLEYGIEKEKQQKELGKIPSFPEEFVKIKGTKKWNGRIYGFKEKSVYLDNEKVIISDELVKQIEETIKQRELWKKKRDILETQKTTFIEWLRRKSDEIV